MFAPFRLHMGDTAPTVPLETVQCCVTQLWGAHDEATASCCDFLQIIFMTLQDSTMTIKWMRGASWCETNRSHIFNHNAVFTWHTFDWLKLLLSPPEARFNCYSNNVTLQKCCTPWPLLLTLSGGECGAAALNERLPRDIGCLYERKLHSKSNRNY